MNSRYSALAAALIGCGALSAPAQAQWAPDYSFSGFATLAAVRTNTDKVYYGRDRQAYGGADRGGSLDVDSNIGLQATVSANKWLSATAQLVAMKRQLESSPSVEAEWGFVKVTPLEGLSIRAGRTPVPVFMVSDSLNVGYANVWLRAPTEVYGLVSFRRMQGFDVSYQLPIGSSTLSATVFSGSSIAKSAAASVGVKNIIGLNVQLETEWATFRYGEIQAKYDFPTRPDYGFKSVGVNVDRNDVIFQAEYVKRIVPAIATVNSDGWYVMGGYRMGKFVPYGMYGSTDPKTASPAAIAGSQRTSTLGLRWDAYKSTSVKAQLEYIDTKGTKGISFVGLKKSGSNPAVLVTSPVTAISVAVDVVF